MNLKDDDELQEENKYKHLVKPKTKNYGTWAHQRMPCWSRSRHALCRSHIDSCPEHFCKLPSWGRTVWHFLHTHRHLHSYTRERCYWRTSCSKSYGAWGHSHMSGYNLTTSRLKLMSSSWLAMGSPGGIEARMLACQSDAHGFHFLAGWNWKKKYVKVELSSQVDRV